MHTIQLAVTWLNTEKERKRVKWCLSLVAHKPDTDAESIETNPFDITSTEFIVQDQKRKGERKRESVH